MKWENYIGQIWLQVVEQVTHRTDSVGPSYTNADLSAPARISIAQRSLWPPIAAYLQ
jgi:hypothetical protein